MIMPVLLRCLLVLSVCSVLGCTPATDTPLSDVNANVDSAAFRSKPGASAIYRIEKIGLHPDPVTVDTSLMIAATGIAGWYMELTIHKPEIGTHAAENGEVSFRIRPDSLSNDRYFASEVRGKGSVNLQSCDTTHATGTFTFDCENTAGTTVTVRNGTFDLPVQVLRTARY